MPLLLLLLLAVMLAVINVFTGSIDIPSGDVWAILTGGVPSGDLQPAPSVFIIRESRLPAALTAALTGAALGASGLTLQSYFRNPLAGPSVLGITSGASLAVAVAVVCGLPAVAVAQPWGGAGLTLVAAVGAAFVLAVLAVAARLIRQAVSLLIVGMMLSYLSSALVTLLSYHASHEGLQHLMLWGAGTFGSVGRTQLPVYATAIAFGLGLSLLLVKPLNGWMLGELYAQNAGISLRRTRLLALLSSGLLCAVTTAWCGPIAFIGLAAPHVARWMERTDDHRRLMPASMLAGSAACSLCLWLSTRPDGGRTLPINALTPLLGIPVILWVVLRRQ